MFVCPNCGAVAEWTESGSAYVCSACGYGLTRPDNPDLWDKIRDSLQAETT